MSKKNKKMKTYLGLVFLAAIAIISFFIGKGCGSTINIEIIDDGDGGPVAKIPVSQIDYTKAIECVYNQLEMYDKAMEKEFSRVTLEMYTIGVNQIDISSCPDDFKSAYKEYVSFIKDFNQFMKEAPISSFEKMAFSFVHPFDGKVDELMNDAEGYARQGVEKQAKLDSIASKYGVVFDKDGNVIYKTIKKKTP